MASTLQDNQITSGVYGPPGVGKSADKIWSFPNALHIAGSTALVPAVTLCGFQPAQIIELDNPTLDDVRKAVKENVRKLGKKIDAVCIDDGTNLLVRTARKLEQGGDGVPPIKDGRKMYGTLAFRAQEAIDEWVSLGLHVSVDFHVQPPVFEEKKDKEGNVTRGTLLKKGEPAAPGQKIGHAVVSMFGSFFRVVSDPVQPGWPYAYAAGPQDGGGDWLTKDRWNVALGQTPMNLAEIFREAHRRLTAEGRAPKWTISRPPGWEWHEQAIASLVPEILGMRVLEATALADAARQMQAAGKSIFEIRSFARDLRARVALQRKGSPAEQLKAMGIFI